MLIGFLVILAVLICAGYPLRPRAVFCLPFLMAVEYVLALGFTFVMSAVMVYIRDLEYLLGIVMMAWQFLTPVMYAKEQAPEHVRWIFTINPMTGVITAYRDILYYGKMPKTDTLLSAAIVAAGVLFAGWYVFRRLQRRFAEEM